MRVLMAHNYYRFRGGEDEAMEHDVQVLRTQGHHVDLYTRHSSEISNWSLLRKLALPLRVSWSMESARELAQHISTTRPDIVHVHNFFPILSPSIFHQCRRLGIPVVHTLHNYRILCPRGLLSYQGKPCHDCPDKSLWRGLTKRCYRDSLLRTLPISAMIWLHNRRHTWERDVSGFIAVSEAAKAIFVKSGWSGERIRVRPNFLNHDPGVGTGVRQGAIFVGRLDTEKGLHHLVEAWRTLPDVPLTIIGTGPLESWLKGVIATEGLTHIRCTGYLPHAEAVAAIKAARLLVMPSIWYETFGRNIMEAYATGTPVVAARLGAMEELVTEGETGLLVEPGNSKDLKRAVTAALASESELARWGANARARFETRFTAETGGALLATIYTDILAQYRRGQAGHT
ncbi:MAG: glycosyltransferase family 4 protein [Lentisphaerae bacterium]|nr:glycosyltransferase family 4 protein [Lentisphaerota bacterium]